MLKFLKITASSLLIIFFSTILNAEENFCLDNDGLILPLFDDTECLNTDDLKITKKELNGRVPLIGFAGAPWTIFSYMTEGQGSKTFSKAKKLLYQKMILQQQLKQLLIH